MRSRYGKTKLWAKVNLELHLLLHEDVSRGRMKDVVEGEGVAVEGALVEKVTWEEFKWPVL